MPPPIRFCFHKTKRISIKLGCANYFVIITQLSIWMKILKSVAIVNTIVALKQPQNIPLK